MANSKVLKKVHSTPGVYFTESELNYSAKSLGITALGVVGETLKGPAFQLTDVEDWSQYQSTFGGTSTEKFKGSQYPKYELPYIAKEYLKKSQNLKVCRVLGLSGVNAGPAWLLTAYKKDGTSPYKESKPLVIGVLRSRGEHLKAKWKLAANKAEGICNDVYAYDEIEYYAEKVKMARSASLEWDDTCNPTFNAETGDLTMSSINYGMFTLVVDCTDGSTKNYAVSLNPTDKNYIVNVLGSRPEVGDAEIYVEELYDIAIEQLVNRGEIDTLANIGDQANVDLKQFPIVKIVPKYEPVDDILTMDESMLTNKHVGKRYLFSKAESVNSITNAPLKVHFSDEDGKFSPDNIEEGKAGHIYTVMRFTNADGTRSFWYAENRKQVDKDGQTTTPYLEALSSTHKLGDAVDARIDTDIFQDAVLVKSDSLYYVLRKQTIEGTTVEDITFISLDLNNYKEPYRYASTPWVVSEMKGSAHDVELTKLFRFHTISDGANANTEVKVSIENIDPERGTFDVIVRDFNDSDKAVRVLERYKNCNLIPGSENYIAYLIGSTDNSYITKSKYITVEVNETDKTKISIPAGFMGYPVRAYDGYAITGAGNGQEFNEEQVNVVRPYLEYNTSVDNELRITKQYFGMSDLVGIDADVLSYKGIEAYNELPYGLTPCFHLDSRIFSGNPDKEGMIADPYAAAGSTPMKQRVTVDGITGYAWSTVGAGNTLDDFGIEPRIGTDDIMMNTIYEQKSMRKFTMCFYGGWDGWDYYRTSRSTGDDFTYRRYRGALNTISGEGVAFSVINGPESFNFEETDKCLTSDYYAYLSAIRMFANNKEVDINLFATPGIDYVNNKLLCQDVAFMIEEERGDSVYVVTTPDKPFGADDSVQSMYTPTDAIDNLEESELDTNYIESFYPWVKYEDTYNNQYVYIPPTADAVRDFAYTDNIQNPWNAAVGWYRGEISDSVKGVRRVLKQGETDKLYDGRLNFVASFGKDGLKLWGDKNFQIRNSHMNRISKRRLVNRVKYLLNKAVRGFIFDPNDATQAKNLEKAIDNVLAKIKDNRGLANYKIKMDNSEEARERLEINGQVFLQVIPNTEYINLSITTTTSGTALAEA